MDRLDACYFCGVAGEAPLREVSIAPRARRGDPDATVAATLCPSCEGKLQTVLGHLFDRVESRRVGGETDAADDGGGAAADEGAGAAAGEGDQRVDRIDVSAEPAGAAAPDASGSTGADPADEDAEVVADGDDEPTVRARASAAAGDALDGVSVAEYNRVMRLLQNREFPMAREAFVDLASSAYDLGEGTVERVLDAVVERGALVERGGDLDRPGGSAEGGP